MEDGDSLETRESFSLASDVPNPSPDPGWVRIQPPREASPKPVDYPDFYNLARMRLGSEELLMDYAEKLGLSRQFGDSCISAMNPFRNIEGWVDDEDRPRHMAVSSALQEELSDRYHKISSSGTPEAKLLWALLIYLGRIEDHLRRNLEDRDEQRERLIGRYNDHIEKFTELKLTLADLPSENSCDMLKRLDAEIEECRAALKSIGWRGSNEVSPPPIPAGKGCMGLLVLGAGVCIPLLIVSHLLR